MEGEIMSEEYKLDAPAALTCPECGGALESEKNGTLLQFRCHIGHVLTGETMLAAQFDVLEARLAASLVALKERAELCRQMSENTRAQGQPTASLEAAGAEALERCQVIKGLLEGEWAETGRAYPRERRGFFAAPGSESK
jgi:two-component system, chemotaxis family, protein-glutamate methylesterase/glutaminase